MALRKCKYKSSSEPKLQKNVTSNGSSEFLGRHPETLVLPHPKVRAASVCRTESREVQNKVGLYSFLKIDNMNFVVNTKNKRFHFWVPKSCLVAIMHTGL